MDPYFQILVVIGSDDLLLRHILAILPHLLLLPFLHLLVPSLRHPLLLVLLSLLLILLGLLLILLAHHLLGHHLLSHHLLDHLPLAHRLLVLLLPGLHHPTLTFNPNYSIIAIASEHIITNTILHLIHKLLPLHLIAPIVSHYFLHNHTRHLQLHQVTSQSLHPFTARQ